MNDDKLFDSGCCLCGAQSALFALARRRENHGRTVCGKCGGLTEGSFAAADAEITRRAALAGQKGAEAWVPKVGDRVEWDANPGDSESSPVITGTLTRLPSKGFADARRDDGRKGGSMSGDWVISVTARRLRPRSTAEAVTAKVDSRNARPCDKCLTPAIPGATLCAEHVKGLGKPVEPKRDPYAEHAARLIREHGIFDDVDAFSKTLTLDCRARAQLSPAERRKREALEQLSRPLPSAHPPAFPADAWQDAWSCDP